MRFLFRLNLILHTGVEFFFGILKFATKQAGNTRVSYQKKGRKSLILPDAGFRSAVPCSPWMAPCLTDLAEEHLFSGRFAQWWPDRQPAPAGQLALPRQVEGVGQNPVARRRGLKTRCRALAAMASKPNKFTVPLLAAATEHGGQRETCPCARRHPRLPCAAGHTASASTARRTPYPLPD